MEETNTAMLESGIDSLIALCATLTQENRALHDEQTAWRAERTKLIERNELAKSKIDAMIGRLRSLDEPLPRGQPGIATGDDQRSEPIGKAHANADSLHT